ncbi:MAG: response regulator [Treponema sp.]|jgi:signal transduction histidine kinase/ActR/RegA family two-component response regulator|nr:response regulator [Treponema sp.]
MSIRLKVFLIITAIILVITASSVIISVSSAQSEIINTLGNGMQSVASVANEYISGELELLMTDAANVVQALVGVPSQEMDWVLREQVAAFSDVFSAITIFNASGRVEASYGAIQAPVEMARSEYGQQAFAGKRVISTSHLDPAGLVFHVFVPMDDGYGARSITRIVALTVPGMFFSKKVDQFHVRGSENIAIGDSEGTILANINHNWVTRRVKFMDLIKKGSTEDADTIHRMIEGETGAERFTFDGDDSIIAYLPLTASDQGWFIAVSSLVAESSFNQVRRLILISGLLFLGLGMIAASLASGFIAKPFYQIKKQNTQLIELSEQVKAAAVAKTNFLANMSFDLRTPLNAIVGLSELSLTKKSVPVDIRGYLERIYESGEKVTDVINDLLDLSNMDSGKFGVMPAEYDLTALINDAAKDNVLRIGSKPVAFYIIPDENLPARLIGDTLRLRQIFNNLLSNAFKHTAAGSVEWRFSAERDGDSVWLVSSVTDTGGGIKRENIEKIFIDYNRFDEDRQHGEGESGMGLTLARRIASLMDGTITVESAYGKGSTFTARIRQKYVNDQVISADFTESLKKYKHNTQKHIDKAEMQRVQLSGKKVLVVDDAEINFEIAHGMIEPYGISVDCVKSAREAVESVHQAATRYDLIFMSRWMSSEIDGKEAVRIIRNEIDSEYARTVPIIALTTNTVIGNKDIFLKWGFQDVLSKPLNVHRLDEAINTWLAPKT